MTQQSVLNKTSRYVQGGLTEVGPYGVEWWGRFDFPTDITDTTFIVNDLVANRIDKIANYFYDDSTLWWVIAQYNNILDPYGEIEVGRVLLIPSKERLNLLLSQKTGGIATARGNEDILPPLYL